MYRSSYYKILGGVCGGISETIGIPAFIVRLIVLYLLFSTSIPVVTIYILMWILLPLD
jgi:phage shock protein PspC (stress-responsive transcriptional regulator)